MTLAGRAIRRVVQAVAVSVVVAGAGGLVAYRSLGDYTVTNALVERTLHLIAGVESLSGHVADANINQRHYVESGGESALALRDAARREVQQDMAALRSGVRDPKAAELLSDAWKTIEANQRSDDRATAARRQGPWPAAREQAFDRQSTDEVAAIHVALQRLAARERELLAERAANQRHLGQLATFALAGSLLGALALAVAAVRLLLLEEASRLEEERRRVTAEAVVRAERDFAQQVVSTMGQGLAVLDDACRLGFVNPALASLVGRPPQELEGRALDEFFTEARWRDARRAWDEPAEPGFRRFEATLTGGDGQEIPVLVAGTPRRAGLASSRTILVVTDLSDLRRKDAALREREAGYRLLAENSTDMIVRLDAESRFIYASPAALGVLGYTPEELLGTLAIECIVEDDRAEVLASVRGAAAAGRSDVAVVVRVRRKDGRLVWLECTGRVLTDPKTGLLEVQGSARDVSDRKRAEEELATKEARFRAATEGSPDGFFIFEALRDASGRFLDFRYVEANPASLRFIGRTETVVGLKRREVSRPKEFDVFGPLFERVLFTGETLDQEVELGFPRGNPLRFVRVLAVKVGDGVAVSLRNVTERVETQRALERSERRFRAAADNSPIGLAICALDGRWLSVNPALCAITGRDRDTLLRTPYKELTHPDDQALGDAEWARLLAGESTSEELVKRYLRPDGTTVWVQLNVVLVREADGRPTYFITQVQDITARREQELALRATLEELRARENESAQLAALVKSSPDAVFSVSREATVLTWNAGATRLYGYTAEEMVGTRVSRLYANVEAAEAGRAVAREVVDGLTVHDREQTHRRADGSLFPVSLSAAPIVDASGTIVAGSLIARDVTERNRLFEEVRALACHDPLTRLPNRALLGEELDKALAQAQRFGRHVAVAFLDLDRFKDLNDTHGHAAGDTVLVEMARRLAACVRRGDTLARVSGDEFCLVFNGLRGELDLQALGDKLIACFARPVEHAGRELSVTGSVGLAFSPTDGSDADTLLRAADRAMYQAKHAGRNRYTVHSRDLSDAIERQQKVEGELRHAVRRNELRLHYQPIVTLDGRVTAFEALLRWNNPRLGAVSPVEFIPVAEEYGLISSIGWWVLEEACRQQSRWRQAGAPPVRIDVNVSPAQFSDPNLAGSIADLLARHALEPRWLGLELTESLVMKDARHSIAQLGTLRDLGVHLSIDDFGTGYSSLSYLHRLPVHTVKIDRSFITEIVGAGTTRPLVAGAINMAREFGLDVVAEGVETPEQAAVLRELGCSHAQGWLFGRPGPADAIRRPALAVNAPN